MTPDQVDRYITFVGYLVQFGSALLLCVLFHLLRRHAARRAYFAVWTRAWLATIVAMAVVITYNLPQNGDPALELGELQRVASRFAYNFTKLLGAALFVIGTRVYAFGAPPRTALVGGIVAAAVASVAGNALVDHGTRAAVLHAPVLGAALGYCGWALVGLPPSRRSLGSRVTGGVFLSMAAVWGVWMIVFLELPLDAMSPLGGALQMLARHNGYIDALLQMLLGSGMVVMLMEDAKREADDARAELAVAHDKLRRDALYDSLTGSLNRRAFTEGVGLEMARATFGAVVVLDMDNLKVVNDSAGHAGGDELLQYLATTLRGVIRPSDRLYRWGGDEFLLVVPGARGAEVQARVEEAIAAAEPLTIAEAPEPVPLVASVGSADYASAEDLVTSIERADGVMYRQKKARRARDRVFRADTPLPAPVPTPVPVAAGE